MAALSQHRVRVPLTCSYLAPITKHSSYLDMVYFHCKSVITSNTWVTRWSARHAQDTRDWPWNDCFMWKPWSSTTRRWIFTLFGDILITSCFMTLAAYSVLQGHRKGLNVDFCTKPRTPWATSRLSDSMANVGQRPLCRLPALTAGRSRAWGLSHSYQKTKGFVSTPSSWLT